MVLFGQLLKAFLPLWMHSVISPELKNGATIGTVVARQGGRWEWTIPDFRTLPRRKGAYFASPDIDAEGDRWHLQIEPNGFISNTWIHISVFGTGRNPSRGKYVSCTVGVKRADHSEETIGREEKCGDIPYSVCLFKRTRLELEVGGWYLPDGQLTVTILFGRAHASQGVKTSTPPDIRTEHSESAMDKDSRRDVSKPPEAKGLTRLSENIKGLLAKDNVDYDVTIVVKGKEFRAHSLILKARSPVLGKMVAHEKNSIHIEDCDPDCFDDFLLFVYSGRTAENLTPSRALGLYDAAHQYDVPDLKEQCVVHLKTSLSTTSVCDVVHLAATHEEKDLLRTATEYFVKNIKTILLTVEWQNFMAQNPTVANELLLKAL